MPGTVIRARIAVCVRTRIRALAIASLHLLGMAWDITVCCYRGVVGGEVGREERPHEVPTYPIPIGTTTMFHGGDCAQQCDSSARFAAGCSRPDDNTYYGNRLSYNRVFWGMFRGMMYHASALIPPAASYAWISKHPPPDRGLASLQALVQRTACYLFVLIMSREPRSIASVLAQYQSQCPNRPSCYLLCTQP